MTKDVRFYHLQSTPLHKALGDLLIKAVGTGRRALVLTSDEKQSKALDEGLWTFKQEAFLAHGMGNDPAPEKTPVWITSDPKDLDTPPNQADMLILTYGTEAPNNSYDLVCDMFDGQEEADLKAARARWKQVVDAGYQASYYQQTPAGGWEKKH